MFLSLLLVSGAWGQATSFSATYTFGNNGNVNSFTYNGTVITEITMSAISKVGVTTSSSNGNFRATTWPTANSASTTKYIGFTMSAATGYKFTVTGISCGTGGSGTGPTRAEWRGNYDSYGAALASYTSLGTGDLTLGEDYKDVTSAGFRIYLYGAGASSGTGGLQGPITINGTFEALCTNPATPTGSINIANNPACGTTSLTYSGSESNTYWQTSATGTTTTNPGNASLNVTTSGTYYLRTRNGTTTCWSTAIASSAVTVYTAPVITSNPVNKTIVGTTNTSFSVTNSGDAQSYTWQVDNGGGWATVTNGGVYSTENTATLTLTNVPQSYNGYKYRAIANGNAPCGSSAPSAEATLTVTDPSIQTVTTNTVTNVVNTTATLNGNATQVAVSPATTERGFVYSITASNADPIVNGTGVTKASATGTSATPFSLNVTSLQPNTQYTVKAYLYNGSYVYGTTQTFTTLAVASHIEFNPAPPSSGNVGQNLTSFNVRALRPDNSVDAEYTGSVTLTKASGTGNISGTLVVNAIAGIATFSNIQFDAPGTYNVGAASGIFTGLTSGNIVISLQPSGIKTWSTSTTSTGWYSSGVWTGVNTNAPAGNEFGMFIQNSSTVTNIGVNFSNGSPNFSGIIMSASRVRNLEIGSAGTSGTPDFILNGGVYNTYINLILLNESSNSLTIKPNVTQNNDLTLVLGNATENKIVINSSGNINITSIISGANRNLTKIGSGTGELVLSGANTYTGLTTVTEGTLQLNRTGGTTLPVTNSILINGGKLLVNTNQTLSNLTLTSGQLEIPSGVTLTVNGDFKYAAGTITGTGNLVYGNSAKLVYENTTSHNIGNEWNASTKEVDLNTPSDLVATGNLTVDKFKLTSGKLTLGANNLTVGQIEGGSKTSFIVTNGTGALTVKNVAATAVIFPVGMSAGSYSPARISNTNTNDFTVKVRAMTDIYGSNPSWSYSNVLNKVWDITPAGTGANANITLFWDTDNAATEEGEAFHENTESLRKVMIHFTGTDWEEYLTSTYASASGLNSVNYSGITAFSPFGAALEGQNTTVLPVNIKSFAGNKLSQNNVLNWELATETNISKYIIERSINGTQYIPVGTVNYNTANGGKYSFEDAGVNTIAYYRLKIVNNDGSFSYSKIIMLNRADVSKLTITPNPVINSVFVTFGKVNTKAQLFVTTINGSVVKQIALAENSIQATVDASALSAGTYFVTIKDGNNVQTKKFIKL